MARYIERYHAGEHETVWNELSMLGGRVFEQEVYDDALEVARETMSRARKNVERLIERLDARGYRFCDTHFVAEDPLKELDTISILSERMKSFASDRQPGPNAHAQNVMNSLAYMQSRMAPILDKIRATATDVASRPRIPPLEDPQVYSPPADGSVMLIERLEGEIGGPLPLSLRAWYEQVGRVSFLGFDPVLNPNNPATDAKSNIADVLSHLSEPRSRAPGESIEEWFARLHGGFKPAPTIPRADEQTLPDPLVIFPIEDLLDQLSHQPDRSGDAVELVVAPDDLHKADISGDAYYIRLPDAQADFRFGDWHRTSFVNYLRAVFRWGGFPGWSRSNNAPMAEILDLREGLLPI